MQGFKNALIYVEGKGIIKTNLAIENGLIKYIGDDESKITNALPYVEGQVVVAGFIDQHIHGAGGADAMDGTMEALSTIANAVASEGTTTFLATTMTQSEQNILNAMKAVNEYIKADKPEGAKILGIHLEGPFIATKFCGAQDPKYIVKPNVDSNNQYQSGDFEDKDPVNSLLSRIQ